MRRTSCPPMTSPHHSPRPFLPKLEKVMKVGGRTLFYTALTAGILMAGHWASGAATVLTWDASTANPTDGPQDGSGTWDSSSTNWWNGTADQKWTDSTADSPVIAQFGANTAATT